MDAHQDAVPLCAAARVAIDWPREIPAESERLRQGCECRRRLWEVYRRGGYLLMCCAHCGRVRLQSGEWVTLPVEISQQLRHMRQGVLSHGMCEDCWPQQFPRYAGTA